MTIPYTYIHARVRKYVRTLPFEILSGSRAVALAGCVLSTFSTGCEGMPEELGAHPTPLSQSQVDQAVELVIAPEAEHLLAGDDSILDDAEGLAQDLARMSHEAGFAGASSDGERIVVTFTGKIPVVEADADSFVHPGGEPEPDEPAIEPVDMPGFVAWSAVHVQTQNEFVVEFPRALLDAAGEQGEAAGLHLGSGSVSPEAEEQELIDPKGRSNAGNVKGWSNASDDRTRRGNHNVAQTDVAYSKLVDFNNGNCSGTLVGPKHVLTAAHCIRNNGTVFAGTSRAGRSGTAWRSSAQYNPNPMIASTWYWTPAQYNNLTDPNPAPTPMPWAATPWDIGMIVTHTSRMGDVTGWMGWYFWHLDSSFTSASHENQGYPGCNASWSERPSTCATFPNALWGDTNLCDPQPSTAGEASPDADGINRRFRMACDTSRGQSGSPTYTYIDGSDLAVTGVFSWQHCFTCSAGNDRPNTSVRITDIYSDSINALRLSFP